MYKCVRKVIIMLFVFWGTGCSNRNDLPLESTIRDYSRDVVSDTVYKKVYQCAFDSIRLWTANCLRGYIDCKLGNWGLDSLVCFNNTGDKCGMVLWMNTSYSEATADYINYFNGVRIKRQWYFFRGPSIMLPREMFGQDIHKPMSPAKLHEIAMKLIFSGYLSKMPEEKEQTLKKSGWVINEDFFGDLTSVAWCTNCSTKAEWDSAYLYWVADNWRARDTIDCIVQ